MRVGHRREAPVKRSENGGPIERQQVAASRTASPHMIRLSPDDKAEAGLISRELDIPRWGWHANGESASAGVGAILQAAGRFRKETGRTLKPEDIDEAARRVASRRRKGAGNG
jgi:hypothetical protein